MAVTGPRSPLRRFSTRSPIGVKRFRIRAFTSTVKGRNPSGGYPAAGCQGNAGNTADRKISAHASAPPKRFSLANA
jgi:hypothetical protein